MMLSYGQSGEEAPLLTPEGEEIDYHNLRSKSIYRNLIESNPVDGDQNGLLDSVVSLRRDKEFDKKLQDIKDAIQCGVHPERIVQGSSGSYFCKNAKGEKIGVFKPKDEEPYGSLNPKWTKWLHRTICPCAFGRSCLIPNQGYLSEAGASIVDDALQLNVVPRTKVVKLASPAFNYDRSVRFVRWFSPNKPLPPKTGSLQMFVAGYKDAIEMVGLLEAEDADPHLLGSFQPQFERMVVLDYITRNTDRGMENWLLKIQKKEGRNTDTQNTSTLTVQLPEGSHTIAETNDAPYTISLAAIDNGLNFPFKHPDSWRTYPYHWAWLPQARIPFSEALVAKLMPLLIDEAFVESMIERIHLTFKKDKGFSKTLWLKQASVIRGQVMNLMQALKDRLTPWQLLQLPIFTITEDGKHRYQQFVERTPCFTWC